MSQFSADGDKKTLSDFFTAIPKNIYPAGRLDYDSEGLLLLTDDKVFAHRLLDPQWAHERTYLVQVEGEIDQVALNKLSGGLIISIDGNRYTTQKAKAVKCVAPPAIAEREPPIRFRKNIPTSCISLTLTEGKNRQVRRMTAAAGFPTLRLVRCAIGSLTLEGIAPGEYKILRPEEAGLLLKKAP